MKPSLLDPIQLARAKYTIFEKARNKYDLNNAICHRFIGKSVERVPDIPSFDRV